MSVSDEEFIEFFKMHGATGTAKKLQLTIRSVFERRRRLEKRLNIKLIPPSEEAKKYKSIIIFLNVNNNNLYKILILNKL